MEKLLPANHLMLASAKRVKALILEEIAIDNAPTPLSEQNLLFRSECLHLSALQLAKTAFGERNVQTAKHYGNLGRLYQSMRRFQVSFYIPTHIILCKLCYILYIQHTYALGGRSYALKSY